MSQIERKIFGLCEVKATDTSEGIIEAIVSVFNNTDEGGDVVRPGAFVKSLARKLPVGVWGHDWEQPIAKTLVARELEPGDPLLPVKLSLLGGLYIKGQFNLETQRGREGFSDVKFGIITEFSIGYVPSKVLYNEADWTRELIECDLYEWSPVVAGMNPETALISAKSLVAGGSLAGLPLDKHFEGALAAISEVAGVGESLLTRVKSLSELRQKDGRVLSSANINKLKDLSSSLQDSHVSIQAVFEAIDELVDSALGEPEDSEPGDDGSKAKAGARAREQKARALMLELEMALAR
ncbi:MAG: HK97 family phage prohead protease [Chloroflexi bacterium]|nr:HK97 family phage prohead protease [Chloroflexota bacterium]